MENQEAKNEARIGGSALNVGLGLLPCPFCNQAPAVDYLPPDGLVIISCQNKSGCGIRPSTYEEGLRLELAKINWNQRPNVKVRG